MQHAKQKITSNGSSFLVILSVITAVIGYGSLYAPPASAEGVQCDAENTVTANVVALDQPIMFNRLGAQNVNYMMYALERDVINIDSGKPLTKGGAKVPGQVSLRPDKRPRPLVLRVAAGQCLKVNLTNLLKEIANPFNGPAGVAGNAPTNCQGLEAAQCEALLNINNQVEGRFVSFHPLGMQFVDADSFGSNVGLNASTLLDHGESGTYTYYAEAENAYMVYSRGQPFGGEASGGNVGVGLFGVVNVQPKGARFYRSQVTEEEMRLATKGYQDGYPEKTPDDTDGYWGGQPVLDYEAKYPNKEPWISEGKDGLPILNMVTADGELVHSDINAVIAGPNFDGSFPPDTYPLESKGKRNPSLPNRLDAFREFTVVFHDEQAATQAFPKWFDHPVVGHTLHGVRDSFMINYGSGGIGSEIIANRLRVGPMWDCLNCAYEEFFLSSYTVGDPAMLVDVPANANLELCGPDELAAAANGLPNECINPDSIGIGAADPGAVHGIKATQAFFPDDPSNVHHSYKRDFVKFRQLHAGPKEQHIFHLHNHQWLFNPNDDNSNYIDAQGIGPGSGYTLEINYGGAGNRNISAGDAIFHCHFYPHFAQGMWEHWRINDVLQTGTQLAVTADPTLDIDGDGVIDGDANEDGIHDGVFALKNGLPAAEARAYPDGEILAGTPIPAVIPLPGEALPPMPGAKVTVEPKRIDPTDMTSPATASVAKVHREYDENGNLTIGNPGYPFWIAGIEDAVGQRSTTPPLDMLTKAQAQDLVDSNNPLWSHPGFVAGAGGWDGGLPRHALEGYLQGGHSVNIQNRLDFTKVIEKAKPIFYPEEGTDLEQIAMAFNAQPPAASFALTLDRVDDYGQPLPSTIPAIFEVNGQLPVPSAPFYEPCRTDDGELFTSTNASVGTMGGGSFFGATYADGGAEFFQSPAPQFGADNPRVYMGANIQIDAVLNKVGYHYPQQRIIALWGDVMPVINKQQAPEPLVMRSNSFDCVKYLHANLVPEYMELDDYQVRTPTDIIGQHIHLPKWDLVANDGSGNGWNYEDGTLSPGMVRERIHAINNFLTGDPECIAEGCLTPEEHPFFGQYSTGDHGARAWLGARTTVQRWFTDPVVNAELEDRGLGIVFTHDHYGPSTHQQVGLYSTILAQPAQSTWKHNETGEPLYGREVSMMDDSTEGDGGPTSWQAIIEPAPGRIGANEPGFPAEDKPFREFYFEFGDFQHAYEAGTYVGIAQDGDKTPAALAAYEANKDTTHSPVTGPGTILDLSAIGMEVVLTPPVAPDGPDTFRSSINPSFRQEPKDQAKQFPDIVRFPPWCPGTQIDPATNEPVAGTIVPRPCAEAISADDVGLIVTNYRAEPIGLRVFDPSKPGPDGKLGAQADGLGGDLAFALQSRTDRAIPEMNRQVDGEIINETIVPPGINAGGVGPGDPFTPMLRTYTDDLVKIKIQAGSTEHEHNATIHGVKWLQAGSGFGQAPNSGWRNAQNDGISEQFTFHAPLVMGVGAEGTTRDYAYALDSSQDGWWTGNWGIMRSYDKAQPDLALLPGKDADQGEIVNADQFDAVCPIDAPVREYTVVAVLANDVLPPVSGLTLDDPADLDLSTETPVAGFVSNRHVGARVNPDGGTLVYNNRPGGDMDRLTPEQQISAGLHDPTAMLYVQLGDLEPIDPTAPNCQVEQPKGGKKGGGGGPAIPPELNAMCPVKLKDTAAIEPLALRANAGDCLKVTLYNRLPAVAPDVAGFNTLLQMVNRDPVQAPGTEAQGLVTFNNNLIRPSSYVGLHPQLVEYDVETSDGAIVGLNGWNGTDNLANGGLPNETSVVAPISNDELAEPVTYTWYAGHLEAVPAAVDTTTTTTTTKKGKGGGNGGGGGQPIEMVATPVEFGGFNLNPADKIKQGQKALVGAGVILPEGSSWTNDAGSNTVATVTKADGSTFRDAALVFQKGLNHRFSDGTAVPNIAAEGRGVPEDSHDAGQMAINYGSEPLWYRFGYAADAPLGNDGAGSFGGEPNPELAYSNTLPGVDGTPVGDPVTPVITATAGEDVRLRVLEPTGAGRGTTFVLDGHAWQRDPYRCNGSAHDGFDGKCNPFDEVGARDIAGGKVGERNPIGFVIGHQESVTPGAHFDIVPLNGAGGKNAVPGDYLFSDQGSFGPTSGLWGILRVNPPAGAQ